MFRFTIQQQLLAGFGFGPNLRYLRIARNNKKISDIAFKDQVIATITQIENIYWDLVSAYEQTQVNEQSSAFARQTLDNARKQLQLESIPELDVLRAEAEVSKRDQELTVARTSLQLQETLMKNAVTKNLSDPVLEGMPVVPTDRMQTDQIQTAAPIQDLIAEAVQHRPESGTQCVAAVSCIRRLLWWYRPGGSAQSSLCGLFLGGPCRFWWRVGEYLQQLVPRLLYWFEPEYPDPESSCQG